MENINDFKLFRNRENMDKFIDQIQELSIKENIEDEQVYILMEAVFWTSINLFSEEVKKNFKDDNIHSIIDNTKNNLLEGGFKNGTNKSNR